MGSGLIAAGAAAADTPAGVTAKIVKGADDKETVQYLDPKTNNWTNTEAGPFFIRIGDAEPLLPVYCIDLLQGASWQATYNETSWDESSLKNNPGSGPKILWILKNSYPTVGADALATASGVTGLTKADAAAGTQVAIWSFSDPKIQVKQGSKQADDFAKWLIAQANEHGKDGEPKPTLSLDPASVGGKPGTSVGPITVTAGGGTASVSLSLDDAGKDAKLSLVDDKGAAVKDVKSGDKFFAKIPADATNGHASITASGKAAASVGRAFVGRIGDKPSQTLILAGTNTVPVAAAASVTWGLGAVPTADAAIDCAKGALVVTLGNKGDKDAVLTVGGKEYTVAPNDTKTVTLPAKEDEQYSFTVTGPEGFTKTFTGLLNCKTDSSTTTPSPAPSPSASGPELASTGGGMGTGITASVAGVLVLAGGAAVYGLRRRGRHSRA
ncbi:Cys-Gln thioester bond-forming surface protein [Kitasatospora sp. NPDC092948]|uniref:Cys-Gln thioester bond-forming surface protein n=1 Tax=Kitasatospora sp. NPDC092948 TaxID=3364088 RepID=UPI0037F15D5B